MRGEPDNPMPAIRIGAHFGRLKLQMRRIQLIELENRLPQILLLDAPSAPSLTELQSEER